ncbi:MAG: protein kinase, partial [Coxiellaceae bacterium]|nr:protein kinase [Coxiellaceae bacterium]
MRTEQQQLPGNVTINIQIRFNDIQITESHRQRPLGMGGFGVVYQGEYRGETVAIKQLRAHLSQDMMHAFEQETQIMSQLRHDNVLLLHGVCLEPGHLSMVLPYAPKGSLYSVLRNNSEPLEWPTRIQISIDIGKGLNYLHRTNPMILHRDLKSMNVLLFNHYVAKIADFGLSAIKKEVTTLSNVNQSPMGTIPWMAPELFGFQPRYSTKSDIYAYAILLLEIATRKLPYHHVQDVNEIRIGVKAGERDTEALATVTDVPPFYSLLIQQAWDQIPEKRPDASNIVKTLENILNQLTGMSLTNTISVPSSTSLSSGYQGPTEHEFVKTTSSSTNSVGRRDISNNEAIKEQSKHLQPEKKRLEELQKKEKKQLLKEKQKSDNKKKNEQKDKTPVKNKFEASEKEKEKEKQKNDRESKKN